MESPSSSDNESSEYKTGEQEFQKNLQAAKKFQITEIMRKNSEFDRTAIQRKKNNVRLLKEYPTKRDKLKTLRIEDENHSSDSGSDSD